MKTFDTSFSYEWSLDWQMGVVDKKELEEALDGIPKKEFKEFLRDRKWYVKSMDSVLGSD